MIHQLICIPYDSGHPHARMGAGPMHLAKYGAVERLQQYGSVMLQTLDTSPRFPTEIGTAFALHRAGASAVEAALRAGKRPIVLSGNCNSSLGTVAGIQRASPEKLLGVFWFDGHGDCNTPATFNGDFLDAMGISTLTGRCWQALVTTVAGFRPLPDENVVLVGGHGADLGAKRILSQSAIEQIPPDADILNRLMAAIHRLTGQGITQIYFHLDVDVLDPTFGMGNEFAPPGGLRPETLIQCAELLSAHAAVAALGIASFDPALDINGTVTEVALEVIAAVARNMH